MGESKSRSCGECSLGNGSVPGAVMEAQQERDIALGVPESHGEAKYTQIIRDGGEGRRDGWTQSIIGNTGKGTSLSLRLSRRLPAGDNS